MIWIFRFLGLYDKKQAERTQAVADYVHKRKNEFTLDMAKIQLQAKKVHEKTNTAHEEAIKLKEMVDGVTANIAIATGGSRRVFKRL